MLPGPKRRLPRWVSNGRTHDGRSSRAMRLTGRLRRIVAERNGLIRLKKKLDGSPWRRPDGFACLGLACGAMERSIHSPLPIKSPVLGQSQFAMPRACDQAARAHRTPIWHAGPSVRRKPFCATRNHSEQIHARVSMEAGAKVQRAHPCSRTGWIVGPIAP
jgi:hypothetical protein